MENQNKKLIGIIGDLHLSETLPYNDIVNDGRDKEKREILNFIVEKTKDCASLILVGDIFDKKNNPSSVIREVTEFLERFGEKKIHVISGNHEKKSDGTTALDYLKEIKDKNWKIITSKIETIDNIDFCPYFSKAELGAKDNEEGQKMIMSKLKGNKILVVHHAISDSLTVSGQNTNLFDEIVLPRKELSKRYDLITAGHIHLPEFRDNVLVTGSVFNLKAGETDKNIWKIDSETLEVEKVPLPGRGIYKFTNPTINELKKILENSIVKVLLTDSELKPQADNFREELKRFDAGLLLENYLRKKREVGLEKDLLDMTIKDLLKIYSKKNKVSLSKLLSAWELIDN